MELKLADWELTKQQVESQQLQTRITLAMHEAALKMIEEKIATFKSKEK